MATCKRAHTVEAAADKMGVKVKDIYWTLGPHDGVIIMEAPDEEAVTALMLQIGSHGNVWAQTARAFTSAEMETILAKV